jgi:HEAT repeat protein
MSADEQAILDHVNADNWAVLYLCRWSKPDAERVVSQLVGLLDSGDSQITQEALRALFRIGTPAALAAPHAAKLIRSPETMTKHLAVMTLGQIAHKSPDLCVEPLASALNDPTCCRDALRALTFIGPEAEGALDRIKPLFSDSDAKVRKAAVVAAAAINVTDPEIIELLRHALGDRSRIVREAAGKCLQAAKIG